MDSSAAPTRSPVQTWTTTANQDQPTPIQPNLIVPADIEINPKLWYRIVPITIPVIGLNGVPTQCTQELWYELVVKEIPVMGPNNEPTHYRCHFILKETKENENNIN
ncbi:hypothetical protein PPL_05977 [Heterostelium album PN500]|uniref:Uncharacterized protein n=1 Tax=Heterostelium pallidum (strain ATCC 26659 / Pp 5 / PN500) TaxID=670386 RepID=D3BBV7_HETP5|nr:hypothetical protein PPL_05977 [Heterostelium album PN500]EFA81140.1 hypothetical protein PPL_05977 [Heterostelium album PN500]|eukprot:XP_020433258.1 hypothetical protein PPL_05977 [Heterostelium album PN500]